MNYIYTDGSYAISRNGAIATWSAAFCTQDNRLIELHTGEVNYKKKDPCSSELIAIIKALELADKDTFYILVTDNDSVYLYTKGKTKPKKHKELYEKLDKLLAEKHVLVTKTKAHNGKAHKTTNFNGIVDSLARHTYRLLANK